MAALAALAPPDFLSFAPPALYARKLLRRLGRPITFSPRGPVRGRALLSYVVHPFCITRDELMRAPHTNPWETLLITEALLRRGFAVDIIDWTNRRFVPRRHYDLLIDIHHNLERLGPLLPRATKIFYSTGSHWRSHNDAEAARLEALRTRRGITLAPHRQVPPEAAAEHADHILALSPFAASTYKFAHKPTTVLPLFSIIAFPEPRKDWATVRKNFVFIGGGGAIHKGLDLVLEAFASLPDHTLTICGPMAAEEDFARAYARELALPNIRPMGRLDIRGEAFAQAVASSVGLVYPSCSEGQAGSVLVGLAAGLIPIVMPQSGVEVEPFGITLRDASVAAVRDAVLRCSSVATSECETRAREAWACAQSAHSVRAYAAALDDFFNRIAP
jgi:glycosyltransferase involved in cell wall biosynthesis